MTPEAPLVQPMFRRFTAVAFAISVGAIGVGVACSSSSTTTLPLTGITISADSFTNGHGCGAADGEVYKYAAVAWESIYDGAAAAVSDAGTYAYGNIFDCYTDGVFANLPGEEDGSVSYTIQIGAMDESTYDNDVANGLDASAPSLPSLEAVIQSATYQYSCSAAQQQNITVVAVCNPGL